MKLWMLCALHLAMGSQALAETPAVTTLLVEYQAEAATPFAAERGHALWHREQDGRSCLSCHGDSLHTPGQHQKTGKVIEPMARQVNPERLTEVKKIKKWLRRNCKWTFGRECTAQEKGDVLVWLVQH